MNPTPSFVVPVLTGADADLRLDQITGVADSRSRIFVPTMNVARQGFNSPGRLAPPSARGLRAWTDGVEELRLRFEPFGWHVPGAGALNGAGLVLSPDETAAIALVSGDGHAGRVSYPPQVKYRRGTVTAEFVQGNFFTDYEQASGPITLYFLLHDIRREQWFAELSRPMTMTKGGMVSTWRPRIQIVDDIDYPDRTVRQPESLDSPPSLPSPTVRWRESA